MKFDRLRRPMMALLLAAAVMPFGARGQELADFTSFAIMKPGGAPVSVDQAADALAAYDVIFIGELHDHVANHLGEMALLRALQARDPKIALSLEQFERDTQPVVDDYLAGRIGEETLKSQGRAWDNYAEAYRPLVEFAKAHGLPVIAANAPASLVRCVAREGAGVLSTLAPDKRSWAAAQLHTEDGAYKQKFAAFLNTDAAHGGSGDAGERNFAAQVTRDDTMAESIADYLRAHPGGKVMHVTGGFHVEGRLGTVERLKMRSPALKVALIVPVTDGAAADGADFVIQLKPEPQAYVSDEERQAAESRMAGTIRTAISSGCKL